MTGNSSSSGNEGQGRWFKLFFLLILLLLFAAAVLSYSPTDSSILYGGRAGVADNWIGWIGAWLSHLLFLHIGLGVYVLLLFFVIRAVRVALGELNPEYRAFHRWQGFMAAMVALSGALLLLGLVPEMFDEALPSLGLGHRDAVRSGLSGGAVGQFFAAPRSGDLPAGLLRHFIGNAGCAIVGMALLFCGLVWLYMSEWKELISNCFTGDPSASAVSENPGENRFYRSEAQPQLFVTPASVPPERPVSAPVPAPAPEVPAPASFAAPVEAFQEAPGETLRSPEPEPIPETKDEEDVPDTAEAPLFSQPSAPVAAPAPVSAPVTAPVSAPASVTLSPSMRTNELQTRVTSAGKDSVPVPAFSEYVLPPLSMLSQGDDGCSEDLEEISAAKNALEKTLEDFGIRGWVSNHTTGPRVTRFEVTLEPGVNVRKVEQIADNIAMNLAAQSVRILAPIPGRPVVGVEISNSKASAVFMRSVMESEQWRSGKAEIPIALGKDVSGKPVVLDIASAPHMLIAGSTGTGKSVCSNSLIMSLLFRFRPDELKLIMVDPKVVEFDVYKDLPHLLTPVINDSAKVPVALRWAVNEMEKRYRILAAARVKKISEFNRRPANSEPVFDEDGVQIPDRMPVLLVIIDELGDLMMTEAKKDVENSITRIAQKGRAAGVHVVVATQRPSTNVITGVIKANLPTRLCFQVRSLIDSRVVLDSPGGEKLLGKGDMLYMSPTSMHIERVQGSFVPDSDIQKVVEFVSAQAPQQFNSAVLAEEEPAAPEDDDMGDDDDDAPWDTGKADVSELVRKYMRPGDNDVMRQALEVVILDRKASTSYLQRRLGIGYNRAAELIDQMESRGIVGPPSGSGNKRDILVFDGLDIND